MTASTNTFSDLLRRFKPFTDLTSQQLEWLANQAKPFHCSIGQQLFVADRIPEYFYCVIDGRGRLLHHDPALRRPVTLAYAQPGDLIGWAGLARRSPCEWVTAATPLKLIGFKSEIFYELESISDTFAHWIDTNTSPAEIMSVLHTSLCTRPSAFPEEREVLRRVASSMKLLPCRSDRTLPSSDDLLYFWNGQVDKYVLPIGKEVNNSVLSQIPPGPSLRIFSVSRESWTEAFKPPLEITASNSLPPANDIWSMTVIQVSFFESEGERLDQFSSSDDSPFVRIPNTCATGQTDQECAGLSGNVITLL